MIAALVLSVILPATVPFAPATAPEALQPLTATPPVTADEQVTPPAVPTPAPPAPGPAPMVAPPAAPATAPRAPLPAAPATPPALQQPTPAPKAPPKPPATPERPGREAEPEEPPAPPEPPEPPEPEDEPQPTPSTTKRPDKAPTKAPGPPGGRRLPGQAINVELAVTISVRDGSGAPVTRQVKAAATDRGESSIRSYATLPNGGQAPLSLDMRPNLLPDGKIWMDFGLEFDAGAQPRDGADAAPPGAPRTAPPPLPPGTLRTSVRVRQAVVLTDGRPLVISQTSDPLAERTVTVELTARVLK